MKLTDWILGRRLASQEDSEQKIGVLAGVPVLGLDGLSSAAYGPEALLTILLPLGVGALVYAVPLTLVIIGLLLLLYFSYRQTIHAYPHGGGSYTVAKENLGVRWGLLAASALITDYILNVAVGISAGVGALTSAFPQLLPHRLGLCLGILVFITLINLRGMRESGQAFAIPTYLFLACLFYVLGVGTYHAFTGHLHPIAPLPDFPAATVSLPKLALVWVLLRAFASGCTAMTGVEAVSNGVPIFKDPGVPNAQKTLSVIVGALAILLLGVAWLSHAYGIAATDPDGKNYQSILSMLTGAVVGRGPAYFITIGSVLAVLALSANTSFADFPRLCRMLALDEYMPHAFATRGRRLVFSTGIVILAVLSAILLIAFDGVTDRLIPLFALGAFSAFTLSQFGMVAHWRKLGGRGSSTAKVINLLGGVATSIALAIILAAKFSEGAWATCVLIPGFVVLFLSIKKHYTTLDKAIECTQPLNPDEILPPIAIVPMASITKITERALMISLSVADEVYAVHIASEEVSASLHAEWKRLVEAPLLAHGKPIPNFVLLPSPYRLMFSPLFKYILEVKDKNPGRQVIVIIPELQEAKWYQYLLHNQRAQVLKARLLLEGDRMISVLNVPWYLGTSKRDYSDA